ncbi:MAG TPA: phosphate acyltransferase PlsX [Gammaproteobacteria bacterium]|nr:phosphate acyltransferase PlsX [Gammaproteobacteria bacterium]
MNEITIALDAMGGDYGPEVTVPAALQALASHPQLKLILVGDSQILEAILAQHSAKDNPRLSIEHAPEQVAMDESPALALRTKKKSSMRIAINLVKEGIASACVSAGNTGALMATARFVLKTLPGIDRPAIMTSLPAIGENKEVWILDLGANVDSEAEHLYQFAVMGSVLVSVIENIEHPKVGLLNIGQEAIKGNDQVKRSAQLLAESSALNYYGYVEGNEIFSGVVNVVVCDGFVGNVALKAIEGAAKVMGCYAKEEFQRNLYTRIAGLIALPVLNRLKRRVDPGRRNGASLVGLQGIVIKSHGGANAVQFAQAIRAAVVQVQHDVPRKIGQEIGKWLKEIS